jgi:hypothetical protein
MSVGSSPSSPPAAPGRHPNLTRALAEAPTLQRALALLLKLAPQARFVGARREGEGVRVLFRLGPPRPGLLALDAEMNGALVAASVLDEAPQVGRRRRAGVADA